MTVKAGQVHALMGENGAGKSTLMNILTGLYKRDAGQILIDGEETYYENPLTLRSTVSVLFIKR